MGEILVTMLVLVFMYITPLVVFVNYLRKVNIGNLLKILFTILYILGVVLTANFMDNLFPFILVILSILILHREKRNRDINGEVVNDEQIPYDRFNFSFIKSDWIKIIMYSMILYVVNIVISLIFEWIFSKFSIKVTQQEVVNDMQKMSIMGLLKYIPISLIFAPILEEFIFRYVLFERLFTKKLGIYISSVLSSVLFAALHYNLQAFPVLLFLAIENCFLIHKKGYWYSVGNHMLFNSMTVIAIVISKIK